MVWEEPSVPVDSQTPTNGPGGGIVVVVRAVVSGVVAGTTGALSLACQHDAERRDTRRQCGCRRRLYFGHLRRPCDAVWSNKRVGTVVEGARSEARSSAAVGRDALVDRARRNRIHTLQHFDHVNMSVHDDPSSATQTPAPSGT